MTVLPTDYEDSKTPSGDLTELPATTSRGINAITGQINANTTAIDGKTALSVDGVFQDEFDLDSDPPSASDVGAYTTSETDAAIAAAIAAGSFATKDADNNITADVFINNTDTTATAAGTTTLTIANKQVQVFTGSTTQTVKLPTTSVKAGQFYVIVNQSSGTLTVQSSGSNTLCTVTAGRVGLFFAQQDTPTAFAHWVPLVPSMSATASTTAMRDLNANIFAANHQIFPLSVTTAAGTTTMTVASSGIMVFTGSTTQTLTLPTTSITAGWPVLVINNSSGAVTVNSSGANLVATLAGGESRLFHAAVDTPTTAAHWRSVQPYDADLATIAGLTATTDNVIQSVSGAWASRTPAQLKSTLALAKGDVGLGNVDNTSNATERAAAATLANKSIALGSNTVTGTLAQFNTAVTDAELVSGSNNGTATSLVLWKGTQAQYDALAGSRSSSTIYVVTP